jgi:hypothetical protein
MGRTTFEPALANDRRPWPTLNVFVLASERPEGTPDHVVTDSDLMRLLEIHAANKGRLRRQPNVKLYAWTPGVKWNRSTPSRVVGDVSTV